MKRSLFVIVFLLSVHLQASVDEMLSYMPQAHEKLKKLTFEEKVGQLFMVAAVSDEELNDAFAKTQLYTMHKEHIEKLIQDYHVGGIIFAGRGVPQQQVERTILYQKLSKHPLLIGQDLEWGLHMRLDGVVRYPRAMTLGAMTNESMIYNVGKQIGEHAQQIGVHINMAPVVDVNNNSQNPVIHDRSFGDDQQAVARKGALYARGLHDAGILACAKHFPGHGDTSTDSHYDLPCIAHAQDRLQAVELHPFKHMIAQKVPAIMIAHLLVPALDEHNPATVSRAIVTDLLKKQLGFKGLVITDGLGMRAVAQLYKPGQLEVQALQAGCDLLLMPVDVPQAISAVKDAVAAGELAYTDIDEKVLKVLCAKEWIAHKNPQAFNPTYKHELLHEPQAYAVQREAYQEAVTLVRDAQSLLPMNIRNAKIACMQIGSENETVFTQTLKKENPDLALYCTSAQVTQDSLSALEHASDVIVALMGMNKFKHIEEQTQVSNYGITQSARDCVQKLREQGKRVAVVLFGSPYAVDLFKDVPTLIVAYEDAPPAQEAAAHIIVGALQARGVLPVKLVQAH